jgi:hypothetical protein
MLMGWRKSVIGIGGIATAIVRTTDLTIDPMPITVRITDLTMATTVPLLLSALLLPSGP